MARPGIVGLAGVLGFLSFSAVAQDVNSLVSDIAEMERLANIAMDGSDSTITQQRSPPNYSVALLSKSGTPAFAFQWENSWVYGGHIDLAFDCPEPGTMRVLMTLDQRQSRPVPPAIAPGATMPMRLYSKSLGFETTITKVTIVDELEQHPNVKEEERRFRAVFTAPANGAIFSRLGPTSNLRLAPLINNANVEAWAFINSYNAVIRPVVEACKKSDPNYEPPPPSVEEQAAAESVDTIRGPSAIQVEAALNRYYGNLRGRVLQYNIDSLGNCITGEARGRDVAVCPIDVTSMFKRRQWALFFVREGRWRFQTFFNRCDRNGSSFSCN